jgi:phospholipid/cholesterol/gamma-HCH transport system substrate-binding protein
MSITKSQQTRLGFFMVAGVAIACAMIAIPIGASFTNRQKTFYTYFSGESLSGLEQGAQTKFNGVPIGKVDKITYDPHDLARVRVEFKIQEDFPMKKDMFARTGAMGITGLKYVEIQGGSNDAPLLKPNSEIPSKISTMASITGKAEVIVAKVELLLNHLNKITEPDSLESIKKVLANLAAITNDFKGFFNTVGPDFQMVSSSVQKVMVRLDSISRDVKSLTGALNSNLSSRQIGSILGSADSTVRSVKNLTETVNLMVKQSREDFSVSMQNLRETMENANELMKVLSENPSLLLRGEQQKERDLK